MHEDGIEILAEEFKQKNFIRKIFSQIEEHNIIYGRKLALRM